MTAGISIRTRTHGATVQPRNATFTATLPKASLGILLRGHLTSDPKTDVFSSEASPCPPHLFATPNPADWLVFLSVPALRLHHTGWSVDQVHMSHHHVQWQDQAAGFR